MTAWSAASRPAQGGRDLAVDRGHGGAHAAPGVALAAVAPLVRLVAARRGARGHGRAGLRATGERDDAGDGRRAARVERLEGQHVLDASARSRARGDHRRQVVRVGIEQQALAERAGALDAARASRNVAGERPSVRASSIAPVCAATERGGGQQRARPARRRPR